MTGKFEIYKAGRGEYRVRFRPFNGQIDATGASYPTTAEALEAVLLRLRAAAGSRTSSHAE